MTLVELKYLIALAQEGHFGRAATRCHVSQPTLSIAINKLEQRLGVSVFERQKNQLHITEVGELLIQQAKRVIEESDKLLDLAKYSKHQLESPLKLGAIFTVAPYLFPSLIPELKKVAPKMPLMIQEDYTANLRVKLQRGELDAIFIALPFTEPSVVVKSLYDEPFVVLMPKNHQLAKHSEVKRDDLSAETVLLLGEGHCLRNQILETCPQSLNSDDEQHLSQGASLETLRHMVAAGMGMTILPSTATAVHHYDKILCTRPFNTDIPQRTIALAWRTSFPRTQAIDALIAALQQTELSH